MAQAAGALTIIVVMFTVAFLFFKIQNAIRKGGIRSEEADEIIGLDDPEMGAIAYPEFAMEKELVTAGLATDRPDPHTMTNI
jgi:ammonia channel protein AmtB